MNAHDDCTLGTSGCRGEGCRFRDDSGASWGRTVGQIIGLLTVYFFLLSSVADMRKEMRGRFDKIERGIAPLVSLEGR